MNRGYKISGLPMSDRLDQMWKPPDPLPAIRDSVFESFSIGAGSSMTQSTTVGTGRSWSRSPVHTGQAAASPSPNAASGSDTASLDSNDYLELGRLHSASENSPTSPPTALDLEMAVRATAFGRQRTVFRWMHRAVSTDYSRLKDRDRFGGTLLHYTAWFNRIDGAKSLLQAGVEADILTKFNTTPLHLASYRGSKSVARALLEYDANVDATTTGGLTPLYLATRQRNYDMIKLLLAHNANPDVQMENGVTPLHLAAEWNKVDLVESLLKRGLAPDVKAEYNDITPLHLAIDQGNCDVVKLLLDNNADTNVQTSYDKVTPLHLACELGDLETLNLLLKHKGNIDLVDTCGFTPTHYAVQNNQAHIIECLITTWKISPNSVCSDKRSTSLLHAACKKGHIEAVKTLLKHKANLDIRDGHRRTPLFYAAKGGYLEVARLLISAGAQVQLLVDAYKSTPVHLACKKGHTCLVKFLLEHGFNKDAQDELGNTPLHMACEYGRAQVAEYLLEREASVTIKNSSGCVCLDVCVDLEQKETALAIIDSNQWANAMRNCTSVSKGYDTTPFRKMLVKMPDVAEVVMNRCIETNTFKSRKLGESINEDSRDYRATFNYEFLEDTWNPYHSRKNWWGPKHYHVKNHPLYIIANNERSIHLLKHPLVKSLVLWKWEAYGRSYNMANISLYFIFLISLTVYAMLVSNPTDDICMTNGTGNSSDWLQMGVSNDGDAMCGLSALRYNFIYATSIITLLLTVQRIIFECLQIVSVGIEYFYDIINWAELLLYGMVIIFASPFHSNCLCIELWQYEIGAASTLLSWFIFLLFMQNTFHVGVYVLIFRTIFHTFLKISFIAILLLVGFTISFFMLFKESKCGSPFKDYGRSLVTVMTMFAGELNLDYLYQHCERVSLLPVTSILWVAFIITLPILMANMLVGLAVGDVKEILETATLWRTKIQVNLIINIDAVLPNKLRDYFTSWEYDIQPNVTNRKCLSLKDIFMFLPNLCIGKIDESRELEKHANTRTLPLREMEEMQLEIQSGLHSHVERVTEELNNHKHSSQLTMEERIETLRSQLEAVQSQLNAQGEQLQSKLDSHFEKMEQLITRSATQSNLTQPLLDSGSSQED